MKKVIDENKFRERIPKTLIKEMEDFGKEFIKKNRNEIKGFLDKRGRFSKFKYGDIKRFQETPIEKFKEYGEGFRENAEEFKEIVSKLDRYLNKIWNDEVVANKNSKERDTFYRIPSDNWHYPQKQYIKGPYTILRIPKITKDFNKPFWKSNGGKAACPVNKQNL